MRASVVAFVLLLLCGRPGLVLAASRNAADRTAGAQPRVAVDASVARAFLGKYCVTCHNQRLKTAGVLLDTLDVDRPQAGADTWERVIRKLRAGTMPPAGMPKPDPGARHDFVSWLEDALDAAASASPNPGRPAVHRLNRTEYANAIRDLLSLEIDPKALLPADDTSYGFDNIADILTVSPALMTGYLSAARRIGQLAIGDASIDASLQTYRVSPLLTQDVRMDETLPFGSRGGVAVRHYFPLDGEYSVAIQMQQYYAAETIRGVQEPNTVDIRLDGVRMRTVTIAGRSSGAPATEIPRSVQVRFAARAGTRVVGITFPQRVRAAEGPQPVRFPVANVSYASDPSGLMAVDSLQIGGPYNPAGPGDTPSRRAVMTCAPPGRRDEDDACAATILTRLARLAYRRPCTADDVKTLMDFYREGRTDGFEAGIASAVARILIAPEFIFRMERDPANVTPGRASAIGDLDLASRLSFFLWSSIPDDELLRTAERGTLHRTPVLLEQAKRMLRDPRASALMRNFGGQWLKLRNLSGVAPDPKQFPDFDDNLRNAFVTETELLLESQREEDRSVAELLTASYTFVNERLARHYQIPHIVGSHFRRVELTDDRRVGLLGHGSILTVTSYPTRTSPVLRGKWILDNLLGTPPPPPPPNVPALTENSELAEAASVRTRLEAHRRNPVCASCHSQMDPLGFALEHFDAVGRWREQDAGAPIDASGVLPDGTAFSSVTELRTALVGRREEFVETVAEKLLTYALGRGTEYYDRPAIRAIVRNAAATDFRWSSVILGVVQSVPFRMRGSYGAE